MHIYFIHYSIIPNIGQNYLTLYKNFTIFWFFKKKTKNLSIISNNQRHVGLLTHPKYLEVSSTYIYFSNQTSRFFPTNGTGAALDRRDLAQSNLFISGTDRERVLDREVLGRRLSGGGASFFVSLISILVPPSILMLIFTSKSSLLAFAAGLIWAEFFRWW